MKNSTLFYIDGKWVPPHVAKTMNVVNPANEEIVGVISMGSAADVDDAVHAARRAFASYSRTSVGERIALITRIRDILQRRADELGEIITREMGAPIWLSRDEQISCCVAHCNALLAVLPNFPFKKQQGTTVIAQEPIGVVGLITPWNWPLGQIFLKVLPALAAGCTSVLKPSEIAPLDAIIFAEILDEAGVPPGVFNLVNGDGLTVGEAISHHPGIDMVSFTGSARAGSQITKAAADTIKRVTLELGGKSANIILDDADLEAAVKDGVTGCFVNCGQNCDAPTRMFVPKSRYDEAVRYAVERVKSLPIGNPMDRGNHLASLASKAQFDKVQGLIQAGINEGATVAIGGIGRPEGFGKGYWVKPTIFSNVKPEMRIYKEEIFGPVLCIIPYADDADAIRLANDTTYGLAAYVQSPNYERAQTVASQLRAGVVYVNYPDFDFSAPYGGYKQSGNGREGGVYGLHEFLEQKAVMNRIL